MSTENLREQIAATLEEHQYAIVTSPLRPACMCGWETSAEWSGTEVHDFHVADAVLAVLGEVTVTEQWGVRHAGAEVIFATSWQKTHALEHAEERPGQLVRRTVVTTRRVGEWEVAE